MFTFRWLHDYVYKLGQLGSGTCVVVCTVCRLTGRGSGGKTTTNKQHNTTHDTKCLKLIRRTISVFSVQLNTIQRTRPEEFYWWGPKCSF